MPIKHLTFNNVFVNDSISVGKKQKDRDVNLEDYTLVHFKNNTDEDDFDEISSKAKDAKGRYLLISDDSPMINEIYNGTFLKSSTKIPRNSNIHIRGNIPYPIDDVRKYYKIKRSDKDADYVIIGDKHLNDSRYSRRLYTYFPVICESRKIVFGFQYSYNLNNPTDAYRLKQIQSVYPDIDASKLVFSSEGEYEYFGFNYIDETSCDIFNIIYDKIKNNILPAKLRTYEDLDIDSSMELTMDALTILFNTVKNGHTKDIKLQVSLLGQYNWRKYKGTLRLIFDSAVNNSRYSSFGQYVNVPSAMTKAERVVMDECYLNYSKCYNSNGVKYESQEDFEMARELLNGLLGIGQSRFTQWRTLEKKLNDINIKFYEFCKLFNHIIKITPANYSPDINKEDDDEDDDEE